MSMERQKPEFVNRIYVELADTDLLIDGKSYPMVYALELGAKHCVLVAQCCYPEGSNLDAQLSPLHEAKDIRVEVREPCYSTNPTGGSLQIIRHFKNVRLVEETLESHLWPTKEVPARRVWACRMRFEVQS